MVKSKNKYFPFFALLLAGSFTHGTAAIISAALNSYTAPYVLMSNTTSGAELSEHVALAGNSTDSTFSVWGAATGTGSTYSAGVLGGNTGGNYLSLNSVKGSAAYNLMSQVSMTTPRSLAESWAVKVRFSAVAGTGSLYLGLYAGGAMTSLGGYDFNRLIIEETEGSAVALGLAINGSGNAVVVRTALNNKLEFWNGSEWVPGSSGAYAATGLNVAGIKEYDFSVSTDGTVMSIRLVDAASSAVLFDITSLHSDLGSNITLSDTARFSAGDIANNSTFGWEMNISSLSLQTTKGGLSLMLFTN
jgi:hypothetical protein